MSEFDKRWDMEAKAKLVEAEAVRFKAQAELRVAQASDYVAPPARTVFSNVELLAGLGRIIGPAVVIHLIWAIAVVAMTWIWVVRGWRGAP